MQTRLIRYFMIGTIGLLVFGFSMLVPAGNAKSAEGGGGGQTLFQSNCMACHSIGGGNGIGPDLLGVTAARDKDWLEKKILDPKALVDSGDEISNELVKEYGMVMPTIGLSDAEVSSIVAYLETVATQDAVTNQTNGSPQDANVSQGGGMQLTMFGFGIAGLFGALILFAIMAGVGRSRLRGVRKSLH